MNEELTNKLYENFPLLYADHNKSCQETAMCWGFSCGNGWYEPIRKMSEKLERKIQSLPEEQRMFVKATQVKEKLGSLCVYMSLYDSEIDEIISEAVKECGETCEICGKKGKMRNIRGWLSTLCLTDYRKELKRKI